MGILLQIQSMSGVSPVAEYISGWHVAAIICLIVGLALIIIEMFIPGVGIVGACGVIALIAAVILRADTVENALITVLIIILLLIIAVLIVFSPVGRRLISRSPITLKESIDGGSTSLSDIDCQEMIGKEGICLNDLRPSGFADFDGERLDVVSRGEFIQNGSRIKIIDIAGIRITVAKVEGEGETDAAL